MKPSVFFPILALTAATHLGPASEARAESRKKSAKTLTCEGFAVGSKTGKEVSVTKASVPAARFESGKSEIRLSFFDLVSFDLHKGSCENEDGSESAGGGNDCEDGIVSYFSIEDEGLRRETLHEVDSMEKLQSYERSFVYQVEMSVGKIKGKFERFVVRCGVKP